MGGWYTSGIYTAYTGQPLLVTESSQVWGADTILGSNTGAIPTAKIDTGGNGGVVGSGGVGTPWGGGDATRLNLFANPPAAFARYTPILFASGTGTGHAN